MLNDIFLAASFNSSSIFYILHLVLFLIALVNIIQHPMPLFNKLLWATIVLLFPFVGLFVYYMFAYRTA